MAHYQEFKRLELIKKSLLLPTTAGEGQTSQELRVLPIVTAMIVTNSGSELGYTS